MKREVYQDRARSACQRFFQKGILPAAGGVFLFVLVSVFAGWQARSLESPALPAPTILAPSFGEIIEQDAFFVAGVTRNDTRVEIYINGEKAGEAQVKNHPSGTASFRFSTASPLPSGGYTVWARSFSQDMDAASVPSSPVTFSLIQPFPRPVLFAPRVFDLNLFRRPWIVGVSQSGSMVEVEIDGRIAGRVQARVHPSGTGDFAFQVPDDLAEGWHSVRARITNGRRMGRWSEPYVFGVSVSGSVPPMTASQIIPSPQQGPLSRVPAPTILSPKAGSVFAKKDFSVKGVVHNGLTVQIFIDDKLYAEVTPPEHPSGVAGFSYSPPFPLSHGGHKVSARAVSKEGVYSTFSPPVSFIALPSLPRLNVATPNGMVLLPVFAKKEAAVSVPAQAVGSGVKVARNDKGVEEVARGQNSGSAEGEKEKTAKEESMPESGQEAFAPPLFPEIQGPRFGDIRSVAELEQKLGQISVEGKTVDKENLNEGALVEAAPAGGVQEDISVRGMENMGEESRQSPKEEKERQYAPEKNTGGRAVHPLGVLFMVAGVIIIGGFAVTFMRDQREMLSRARGSVDFTSSGSVAVDNQSFSSSRPSAPPPAPPA